MIYYSQRTEDKIKLLPISYNVARIPTEEGISIASRHYIDKGKQSTHDIDSKAFLPLYLIMLIATIRCFRVKQGADSYQLLDILPGCNYCGQVTLHLGTLRRG